MDEQDCAKAAELQSELTMPWIITRANDTAVLSQVIPKGLASC